MANSENILVSTDDRLIYISEAIDKTTMGKVCFNLLKLLQSDNEQDEKVRDYKREPIKIYINSCGGSLYDAWSLIDIILNSKTPIYTYCTGYAFSAGFKIFLAGHERFVTKNATLLYHQLSAGMKGNFEYLKEELSECERNQKDIEKYILGRTNISKERLDEVKEKKIDWYIHSEEVEKLGIAKVI